MKFKEYINEIKTEFTDKTYNSIVKNWQPPNRKATRDELEYEKKSNANEKEKIKEAKKYFKHIITTKKINEDIILQNFKELFEFKQSKLYVDGSLLLNGSYVLKLPDILIVNGDLDLRNCIYLVNLPKQLKVIGKLLIGNTKITELPGNLEIGFLIPKGKEQIKKIGKNVKVKKLFSTQNNVKLENGMLVKK